MWSPFSAGHKLGQACVWRSGEPDTSEGLDSAERSEVFFVAHPHTLQPARGDRAKPTKLAEGSRAHGFAWLLIEAR